MTRNKETMRAPRSLRKHIRRRKAALRRQLPPEEAERAIARLTREKG